MSLVFLGLALGAALAPPPPASNLGDERLPPGAVARLGTLRLRHSNKVGAIAFSPDGRLIASAGGGEGSRDNTVRLWNVTTGTEHRCFVGHEHGVYCLAFRPDGKLLASGSSDRTIRLWDIESGREARRLTIPRGRVWGVAFSPDGRLLASVSSAENFVRLWEVATGRGLRRFPSTEPDADAPPGQELTAVAFAPNGKTLVAGSSTVQVRRWEVATGKVLNSYGRAEWPKANGLAFSPDGSSLVTADGTVYLYDVATGAPRKLVDGADLVAFSPVGNDLALAGRGNVIIWDLAGERELRRFHVPDGWPSGVTYSPDGKFLAWAGYGNTVRIWETATGRELHAQGGAQGPVGFVSFALGGRVALVGSWHDEALRVWDLRPGREPLAPGGRRGTVLSSGGGQAFAITPDGRSVALGGYHAKPWLLDVATGKAPEPGLTAAPEAMLGRALTPDGNGLLIDDRMVLALWDLKSRKEVRRFVGHTAPIDAVAFSPDGKLLASSGTPRPMLQRQDTTIRLWDVATGQVVRQIPGQEDALTFSPDGKLLAAANHGWKPSLRLLEVSTGAEVRRLDCGRHYPFRVVFSPDGKILATAGLDGTVRLWDVATGRERRRLTGHRGAVYAVAFSPDGRRLLSGGADTTAILWDVAALVQDAPKP